MGKFIDRTGEKRIMKCCKEATIIRYGGALEIDVMFDDGEIAEKCTYDNFKKGHISHSSKEHILFSRIGEKRQMNNGKIAEIIEYRNTFDIDVKFECGEIVKSKRYDVFLKGFIRLPMNIRKINNYLEVLNPNLKTSSPFIIDEEDMHILGGFLWNDNKDGYVERTSRKEGKILLHRAIMSTPFDMQVDHKNLNKRDNRKSNLRLCTQSENHRNRGLNKTNTSGYKGVSWDKISKKWRAAIVIDGSYIAIGMFDDKKEAAIAYNKSALKYHGNFARLNEL